MVHLLFFTHILKKCKFQEAKTLYIICVYFGNIFPMCYTYSSILKCGSHMTTLYMCFNAVTQGGWMPTVAKAYTSNY
jgi:hypothetical protein